MPWDEDIACLWCYEVIRKSVSDDTIGIDPDIPSV